MYCMEIEEKGNTILWFLNNKDIKSSGQYIYIQLNILIFL